MVAAVRRAQNRQAQEGRALTRRRYLNVTIPEFCRRVEAVPIFSENGTPEQIA